ncbi:Putative ribonuclease H protein At1g65750 [Linum perenne]
MKTHTKILSTMVHRKRDTLISWIPPPDDWVSINTHGSVLHQSNRAATGGIIRDSQGRYLATFTANLGSCSIMRAELRVAEFGLQIAWNMGLHKVILQLDSRPVVLVIEGHQLDDSRHSSIIHQIQLLRSLNWQTKVFHICREANKLRTSLPTSVIAKLLEHIPWILFFPTFVMRCEAIVLGSLSPERFRLIHKGA